MKFFKLFRSIWASGKAGPLIFHDPNVFCGLYGHKHDGVVHPVGSSSGKWKDELGNAICYYCYLCERCGKRIPIDEENAIEKEKKRQEIAAVMNASRKSYGLPPLSWED